MVTFFQSRRTLCLAAILVGYSCFAPEGLADPVRLAQFIDGHCVACHGVNGEAGVDLTSQAIGADLSQQPELIQRVLTAVDTGFMPPQEEESLDLKLRQEAVNQLRILRNEAVQARPQFRRTPIRRMNRLQYNNAVQDLFGLTVEVFPLRERMMRDLSRYFQPQTGSMPDEVKVASRPLGKFQIIERHLSLATPFPQDLRAENGFDTQADHLTLSPVLMDSFLRLSRAVVDSPEFNRRNVGVWDQFFEAPPETQPDSGASPRTLLENRLRPFLTRAFRRTADDAQVQRYVDSVMRQLKDGAEFTEAMKDVAAAVIASPQFLYLHDQDRLPPLAAAPRFEETATNSNRQPEVPRLDDFSLASRLSFFLWGSLPDDELLQLAAARRLQDPVVLSGQVDRML
ncbi:MAG: DUF1595 domain-containing protein, partial [Planctomycetaceae bacterium]|nr:DUF1595 domain-containing protein [Planctomycetaceae bacterium]